MAFVALGSILLLMMPSAVELSVWMGVRGCACPMASRIFLIWTDSRALMKRPPSSASAAEVMTALMIVETVRMAPLSGGMGSSFERKKCPPTLLRAAHSLR